MNITPFCVAYLTLTTSLSLIQTACGKIAEHSSQDQIIYKKSVSVFSQFSASWCRFACLPYTSIQRLIGFAVLPSTFPQYLVKFFNPQMAAEIELWRKYVKESLEKADGILVENKKVLVDGCLIDVLKLTPQNSINSNNEIALISLGNAGKFENIPLEDYQAFFENFDCPVLLYNYPGAMNSGGFFNGGYAHPSLIFKTHSAMLEAAANEAQKLMPNKKITLLDIGSSIATGIQGETYRQYPPNLGDNCQLISIRSMGFSSIAKVVENLDTSCEKFRATLPSCSEKTTATLLSLGAKIVSFFAWNFNAEQKKYPEIVIQAGSQVGVFSDGVISKHAALANVTDSKNIILTDKDMSKHPYDTNIHNSPGALLTNLFQSTIRDLKDMIDERRNPPKGYD